MKASGVGTILSAGKGKPSAAALRAGVSLAALLALAVGGAPAWADGGDGKGATGAFGTGGADGSLAQATGQDANSATASTGGGGGGVDLTTGNGAPGGASVTTAGRPRGATGITGTTGQTVTTVTIVSGTVGGGTGGLGQAGVTTTPGGHGGGGVGISATADVTIAGTGVVTGGTGGGPGNTGSPSRSGGAGGGGVGIFSNANAVVDSGGSVTGGAGGITVVGGGGSGAAAIVLTAGGTVTNSGTLTGGVGGNSFGTSGGAGGDGGAGVQLLSGGTVVNEAGGTIKGGAGGTGQLAAGDGGAGIKGAGIAVVNAGTITGGAGGAGGGLAGQAIQFTGGVNSLEIWSTSDITGNVKAFSAADTFKLGGSTNGSFDVSQLGPGGKYDGFGLYEKTGSSTWTLTGTTAAVTPWTLTGGTLSVSSDANLGAASGTLTFNGGTLQTTSAFTSSRNVALTDNGTFQTDADLVLTGVISGSGLFTKTGAGMLTLLGNNSYTGGTRILGGILEAEGGNAIGDQSAVIAQAGVFRVLGDETIGTLSGDAGTVELVGDLTTSTNFANTTALFYGGITGTGGFVKNGAYRQVLAGNNSYQGATQILGGTLYAVGSGIDSIPDASAVTVAAGATLSLARPSISSSITGIDSDDETIGSLSGAGNVALGDRKLTIGGDASTAFSGSISGAGGSLAKLGTGTLTLSGTNTYTGATTVDAGRLRVDGSLGNTAVSVNSSGTLSGVGTIAGPVTVDGTIAPGDSPGTLTVGSLTLNAGANLDYELGVPGTVGNGVNDLIVVNGDLTLDGTLNITDVGGFGPGVYRLINYGGALTDNGLEFGTTPVSASDLFIQTSIAGEVNLISSAGVTLGFWDGGNTGLHDNGAIDGGDGVWDATNRNWTEADGAINGKWGQDFAVFAGQAGTVTVDDSAGAVGFTGMQFMTNGYVIDGDTLTTDTAATTIRTDAGVTATIAVEIAGSGGLVKTDSGTLVLSGANTYSGGTTISTGTLIGQATSFGSGDILDNAALVFDQPTDAAFSATLSGTGTLAKLGSGNLNLTGTNTLNGATTIAASKLSVNGSLANSAVTVLSGGALGGNGTVGSTTLQTGGVIAPGNSIGQLTIQGNFTGAGGTVEIEAILDGDTSSTDRLVITGDTSGTANIKVIGLGGAGAQTVDGIKIVDVGGVSAGTFNLQGDYIFQGDQAVVAGAYAYRLYPNGVSTPADGDWYLRSALINPVDPGGPTTPLYSPAVPVYEAYAGVLQSFTQLGTLQQRIGNRSWTVADQSATGSASQGGTPIWGRIEASHSEFEPGTSTTGTDYDADLWRLQAGLDMLLSETASGMLVGGLTVHYGTVKSDVSSSFGTGSIDATGYGFGGTLTWYGKNGFYVDTQAEFTWFDSDLSSATLGRKLADDNNGFGYGLGIEAGQKIALHGNWSLTPQAQLSYASVDFDSFTDPYGALVSNGSSDSLTGRLGLSADYESEWKGSAGQTSRSHVYGIANLYYNFLDGTDVDVSGTRLTSKPQQLWGGLGVGGSLSWADDRYSVHGELLARSSLEDFGDSRAFGGSVGFSVKW